MAVLISDAERQCIRDGSNSTNSLKTSYWKQPEHISDPELQVTYLRDVIRSNGLDGNLAEMVAGIGQARALIAQMRGDRAVFNTCKPDIAGVLTDLLQPRLAAQDLLANLRPHVKAPRLTAAAARLTRFNAEFQDLLAPSARWLAGEGPAEEIENADLGIIAEFGILSTPRELTESDRFQTLYGVMQATARLAKRAGRKVVLIPDFAFATLRNRPPHILSFHTAGLFPGFTHFKRGDLPGYLVLDAGGYSGWSTLSGAAIADLALPPLDEAKALCARLWQDIVVANVSKYEQETPSAQADPLPQTYVFVPLQVPGDRTQRMARFSMTEMLDMVVARFRDTGTAVVVKPHPKSKDMEQIAKLIEYNTSCAPTFVQRAGVVAVEQGEPVIARTHARFLRARDHLVAGLRNLAGIDVAVPGGAMYAFFRVEGVTDSLAFCRRLVAEAGLGLAPGIAFGPEGEGFVRWCFAADPARLDLGLERLAAALPALRAAA